MMMRLLVLVTAAAIALGAGAALAQPAPGAPAVPAAAQPGQPVQLRPAVPAERPPVAAQLAGPRAGATAQAPAPSARVDHFVRAPHSDMVESNGKGMALLFWAFALATVGGALFVITRRNLIAAVMGMVGSFLGISAVYMMLYANFLAVTQMLVYAGAIMVLFVFVIMILNRPEDEPVAPSGRVGQVIGGAAMLYLVGRLVMLLVEVKPPPGALAPPPPTPVPGTAVTHDWGSVKSVGTDLFGPGIFPFEAISILLLVAVVGAIAIARPLHEDDDHAGAGAAGGEGAAR